MAGSKVIVSEDLTSERASLLFRLRATYGIKNVWSRDGMLCFKHDNKINKIRNFSEYSKLKLANLEPLAKHASPVNK